MENPQTQKIVASTAVTPLYYLAILAAVTGYGHPRRQV